MTEDVDKQDGNVRTEEIVSHDTVVGGLTRVKKGRRVTRTAVRKISQQNEIEFLEINE